MAKSLVTKPKHAWFLKIIIGGFYITCNTIAAHEQPTPSAQPIAPWIIRQPGMQDHTCEQPQVSNAYTTIEQHACCQRAVRRNIKAARATLAQYGACPLTLHTCDQQPVDAYHLKRDSDTLIIAACGFPACKEQMIADVAFFEQYDLLLIDYRWATPGYCTCMQTAMHPIKRILLDCIADVQAALAYAHSAGYRRVIGHGICFSAGLFVLTQQHACATHAPHFDKLILDSCWLSLTAFADNIIKDPYLLWHWGRGGTPLLLKLFMRVCYLPLYGISYVLLPRLSIADALKNIHNTPLLFIHGAHDALVTRDKFEILYACADKNNTVAVLTPYGHSNNHSKNPNVYAYCCNQFITGQQILL